MFTERDHHQSWVSGAAIACCWLLFGVAVVALFALISTFAAFGPAAIMGVLR